MITRTDQVRGFRKLAALLEATPRLSLPYHGTDVEMSIYIQGGKQIEQVLAYIGAMSEPPTLTTETSTSVDWVEVSGRIHGLKIKLNIWAEKMCAKQAGEWVIPDALLAATGGAR